MRTWLNDLSARFAPRHAILFVIPGGPGGFHTTNLDLYRDHAVFRNAVDSAAAVTGDLLGWDGAAAFRGQAEAPATAEIARRNEVLHHGLTRIALIDLLKADGVVPDGALGISLGEMIAPYAMGAISREDCARLITCVSGAITTPRTEWLIFIVEADHEQARSFCRSAPVAISLFGMSGPRLALLLCHGDDAQAAREWLGEAVRKEAPSGWPYHTPDMYWDREWVRQRLAVAVKRRRVQQPIYSAAIGALLPPATEFDAGCVQWMMTAPAHFSETVSAALADGFDTFVQISTHPMFFHADALNTAEAEGREVRQVYASDERARRQLRALRRRPIEAPPWTPTVMQLSSQEAAPRDPERERLAEALLGPLTAGKPFDVVSSLADPLADVTGADRARLRRVVAASVLMLLRDGALRQAVTADPQLAYEMVGGMSVAGAAVAALVRVVPDFAEFQPLETVRLGARDVVQLMVAR